jgi:hypothetical protein
MCCRSGLVYAYLSRVNKMYTDFCITKFIAQFCFLYSLLDTSALNLSHSQGPTNLSDIYSIFDTLHIRKSQTAFISVSLCLN